MATKTKKAGRGRTARSHPRSSKPSRSRKAFSRSRRNPRSISPRASRAPAQAGAGEELEEGAGLEEEVKEDMDELEGDHGTQGRMGGYGGIDVPE